MLAASGVEHRQLVDLAAPMLDLVRVQARMCGHACVSCMHVCARARMCVYVLATLMLELVRVGARVQACVCRHACTCLS